MNLFIPETPGQSWEGCRTCSFKLTGICFLSVPLMFVLFFLPTIFGIIGYLWLWLNLWLAYNVRMLIEIWIITMYAGTFAKDTYWLQKGWTWPQIIQFRDQVNSEPGWYSQSGNQIQSWNIQLTGDWWYGL